MALTPVPEAAAPKSAPVPRSRSGAVMAGFAAAAALMLAVLAWLVTLVPVEDGVRDWTASLSPGNWMAWTFPTALFYWIIAALLLTLIWLAIRFPETPRRGVLGIMTTRGDRLFISLLGSAFINLAWVGLGASPVWGGLVVAIIYAAAVFRWV